ncbi:MAG: uncharacterized protein KVP18_003561 [Porospora cf. gigantea A]|uniref:uncharacterized protein n=1 Tax=Porospora cf. gigantea A TaxID=2853593 RepID=UPI003559FBEB|nr:MAG: hypothetical protein KVP18_003561 [Porospora cf. gigantea A]
MEWDTAAAHAILKAVGGDCFNVGTEETVLVRSFSEFKTLVRSFKWPPVPPGHGSRLRVVANSEEEAHPVVVKPRSASTSQAVIQPSGRAKPARPKQRLPPAGRFEPLTYNKAVMRNPLFVCSSRFAANDFLE